MYCAVCHKSDIVVRTPTSTLTLRKDWLCIVELLYIVAAKMHELDLCLCVYDVIFVTQTVMCLKHNALSLPFQPYTLSLAANMHLLSSWQSKGDLSTGQVFFQHCHYILPPRPVCFLLYSFLALTLPTEGSLKLFVSPQMCISVGSASV